MTVDSPLWTPARHPLARLLREVAAGDFPAADGSWIRVSPWSPSIQGILAFTGRAVLAVSYDVSDARLGDLGVDGWGGAHDPRVLTELAGPTGWIDTLDLLMLASGRGSQGSAAHLVARPDLGKHAMVEYARRVRTDVQVMGRPEPDRHDIVTLSHGVAGLREISFEVAEPMRGKGTAHELVEMALAAVPEHEVVAACVAPGNAASLRACLRAGFTPVGGLQLFSSRAERR